MPATHLDLDLVYHLEDQTYGLLSVPDPRIRSAAEWITTHFELRRLYVSIAIVDDPTIQALNAQRLDHDWPTDVISFMIDHAEDSVEGEVIASAQTASRVCVAADWTVDDELLLYVIHGILHVVGMDDVALDQRQAMRQMEQACLSAVGVHQAAEHIRRFEMIYNSEEN